MAKTSAGILLYRFTRGGDPEVFLVHPGGPYWAKKDRHAWSIPKGLCAEGEDPLEAAKREFREETGFVRDGNFVALGALRQPGGKTVLAWALEGDCDAEAIASSTFAMEWPPRSRAQREFPEVDRAAWFSIPEAAERIVRGQVGFLRELSSLLGREFPPPGSTGG